MKIKIFLFALLLPLAVASQDKAVAFLEKAIKNMEGDAAVQMTFGYSVYDNAGAEQFTDNGSLKLDGECFSLLLGPMKLWCDGEVQWNYMNQTNEIYITDAGSEDAQAYNPVYLMGLYKNGYKCSLLATEEKNVVTLAATAADEIYDRVIIEFDGKNARPVAMQVFMREQGYVKIDINDYKPKCNFDKRVYRCPTEDFPSAEIVDMR